VDAYVHPAYKVIKAFFLQEKTSLVVSEGLDESGTLFHAVDNSHLTRPMRVFRVSEGAGYP